MNALAIKLIKEAVLRALAKNLRDLSYYQELAEDPSHPPGYRLALQQAVEEWLELQKGAAKS